MRESPIFDGGTAEERRRLLELHDEWLAANNTLDTAAARRLMTTDPTAVFWNINGHGYTGVDHWCRLWDYYRTQFQSVEPWRAFDVKVIVRGDLAVITALRTARIRQIGTDQPSSFVQDRPLVFRGTTVWARERGDWKMVHGHFAHTSDGPRPGGV